MAKILFDNVEELKPFGHLIGDEEKVKKKFAGKIILKRKA
jgi:hypothetical protein